MQLVIARLIIPLNEYVINMNNVSQSDTFAPEEPLISCHIRLRYLPSGGLSVRGKVFHSYTPDTHSLVLRVY